MSDGRTTRQLGRRWLALLAVLLAGTACWVPAQTPVQTQGTAPAPTPAPVLVVPKSQRQYTATDIAQRPYNGILTAPLYPSTPRVQKQFKVEYLFNYAESTYTPPATLPKVARDAPRNTPEATLAVLYSAIRSGDYEGWLSCWDAASRAQLEAITKSKPNKAQWWRDNWKLWADKRFVLLDRLETVAYVILDVRIEDPSRKIAPEPDQQVLVSENGAWVVTNALENDGLVMALQPGEDRSTGKATKEFDVRPAKDLVGPASLTGMAQKEFLKKERTTATVTRTLE